MIPYIKETFLFKGVSLLVAALVTFGLLQNYLNGYYKFRRSKIIFSFVNWIGSILLLLCTFMVTPFLGVSSTEMATRFSNYLTWPSIWYYSLSTLWFNRQSMIPDEIKATPNDLENEKLINVKLNEILNKYKNNPKYIENDAIREIKLIFNYKFC
jgi:hypothetical protein